MEVGVGRSQTCCRSQFCRINKCMIISLKVADEYISVFESRLTSFAEKD